MKEARCRALFLALFTPMLTIEGNVPRLRARSAHFVSHLPVASHEPACESAAFHAEFAHDVKRSTFRRGKDEVSLSFLLFGTGLSFSSILSIL